MENPNFYLEGIVRDKNEMQDFEGPLSLILQLLSKNKIEIRDIRISEILDQYLAYLDEMQSMDLEIASEFVQMAAHLLYIKTRTLLAGEEEVSELELLKSSLEQLRARGVGNVAQVDGDSENVIAEVNQFSPVSNGVGSRVPRDHETRILIATDMLSEGQNLQDAHIVVNYDLPWAIIRLIQRAGRVDRIGQKSPQVYCYSFFPQEGINEIIRLKDRLNDRINANAEAVGSDEVFFEGNKQNLEDIFNEKAGILDEADDGEVDLASQAFQIWESATKDNPELKERIREMPDVVYSTKPAGDYPEGVITYARTKNDSDVLVWLDSGGKVQSQSPGKIFKALACAADTPRLDPLANHHGLVAQAVSSIKSIQSSAAGVLGSKSSTKYRVFTILQNRLRENPLPLLELHLKEAADQVYAYPMKETAKNALGKMLQKHLPVDDIIQTILEFHKENELCIVPEAEDSSPLSARIICSMGMANERTKP